MSRADIAYSRRDLQPPEQVVMSILIVSEEVLFKNLRDALLSQNLAHSSGYKVAVHTCQKVQDILKLDCSVKVDLIVFIIDPEAGNWLEETVANLAHLDGSYLLSRACLIQIDRGVMEINMNSNEVWGVCKKYGLHLLVDNVTHPVKCVKVAERIMNLAKAACGFQSGLPPYIGISSKWGESMVDSSVQ